MIPLLQQYQHIFHPVFPFNKTRDKLLLLDLTEKNITLTKAIFSDTEKFSEYIDQQLSSSKATYGIGGYNELRTLYARSEVFNADEPRRLHLGIDIWGRSRLWKRI